MILAIIGSRTFVDYDTFKKHMKVYCKHNGIPDIIVSGGAIGTDTMAEKWAERNEIEMIVIKPDYNNVDMIKKYGKRRWSQIAPLARNTDIIKKCDKVIAFRYGTSSGTNNAIGQATRHGKDVTIIDVVDSDSD